MPDYQHAATKRLLRAYESDMYELVEQAHAGTPHRIWSSLKGGARGKLKYSQKETAIKATAAVVGSTVLIVTGIATAGVSLGVFAGICAGTYAMRKLITGFGTLVFCRRRNRNWLGHYREATKENANAWSRALAEDSADAVRRLIDHFRRAVDAHETFQQAWSEHPGPLKCNCAEFSDLVDLFARFHHELNKARNYLLPCLESTLFILNQQLTLALRWNTFHENFENRVGVFLESHSGCSDVCYAPQTLGSGLPMRRLEGMTGQMLREGKTIGQFDTQEIANWIKTLMIADVEIEKALTRQDSEITSPMDAVKKAKAYYRRKLPGQLFPLTQQEPTVGLQKMIDQAFRNLGAGKNVFKRMAHSAKSTFRRTTPGEKAVGIVSELVDLGASFVPVGGEAVARSCQTEIFALLGQSITDGMLARTGVNLGSSGLIFLGELIASKVVHGTEAATGRAALQELESADLKSVGLRASDSFKKMAEHAIAAEDQLGKISSGVGIPARSCQELMEIAKPVYEFMHHFDKMFVYTLENIAACTLVLNGIEQMTTTETKVANGTIMLGALRVCGTHDDCGKTCYGK